MQLLRLPTDVVVSPTLTPAVHVVARWRRTTRCDRSVQSLPSPLGEDEVDGERRGAELEQVAALRPRSVGLQQLGAQGVRFSDLYTGRTLLAEEHEEVADATELTGAGDAP